MERTILQILQFDLNLPTVFDYIMVELEMFFNCIVNDNANQCKLLQNKQIKLHCINCHRLPKILLKLFQIVDKVLIDPKSLQFKQSVIAMSILKLSFNFINYQNGIENLKVQLNQQYEQTNNRNQNNNSNTSSTNDNNCNNNYSKQQQKISPGKPKIEHTKLVASNINDNKNKIGKQQMKTNTTTIATKKKKNVDNGTTPFLATPSDNVTKVSKLSMQLPTPMEMAMSRNDSREQTKQGRARSKIGRAISNGNSNSNNNSYSNNGSNSNGINQQRFKIQMPDFNRKRYGYVGRRYINMNAQTNSSKNRNNNNKANTTSEMMKAKRKAKAEMDKKVRLKIEKDRKREEEIRQIQQARQLKSEIDKCCNQLVKQYMNHVPIDWRKPTIYVFEHDKVLTKNVLLYQTWIPLQ